MQNPFAVLEQAPGILIKQKANYFEALTGIEFANEYKIYVAQGDGKEIPNSKCVYKIKEKGNCFLRQCGPACPTDFTVKEKASDALIMRFVKPCGCRNGVCFYPEVEVFDGVGNKIGRVSGNCACCVDDFDIYDHFNNRVGSIRYKCCQWGRCCHCPCGPCKKIHMDVIDYSCIECPGAITKMWSGCAKEILSDADNFFLQFPMKSSVTQKMLFMAGVILIDFIFFEEKGSGSRGSQAGVLGFGLDLIN